MAVSAREHGAALGTQVRDRLDVDWDKRGKRTMRACGRVAGTRPQLGAGLPAPPAGQGTRNRCVDTDEEANHAHLQGVW